MIAPTPSKMATHAKEWKDKSFWPSAGHINYPPKGLAKKNLSMSLGSSTQTVSGKSIMRDLQDF